MLPPAVSSVCQSVAQAKTSAAAAMGVDPTRVTLSQQGGKHKKADEDPLEEWMLHKNEMEIHCVKAESFKMMMTALLVSNKKDR